MIIDLATGNRLHGEDFCPDTSVWFKIQDIKKRITYWEKVERHALGRCVKTYERVMGNIKNLEQQRDTLARLSTEQGVES